MFRHDPLRKAAKAKPIPTCIVLHCLPCLVHSSTLAQISKPQDFILNLPGSLTHNSLNFVIMWSSRSRTPFTDVSCPAGVNCQAVQCIFSHDAANSNSHIIAHPSRDRERTGEAGRTKPDDCKRDGVSIATVKSTTLVNQIFTGLKAVR